MMSKNRRESAANGGSSGGGGRLAPPRVMKPRGSGTENTGLLAPGGRGSTSAAQGTTSPLIDIRPTIDLSNVDISPDTPLKGESPNDLLLRLFDLWPSQLAPSYRPYVQPNPEHTVEHNLRYVRELYPCVLWKRRNLRNRLKAAEMAVETLYHLGKKVHYRAHPPTAR